LLWETDNGIQMTLLSISSCNSIGSVLMCISSCKKLYGEEKRRTTEFTCILERSGKMSGVTICYAH